MKNPAIGITERGDAGIDLSWANRLDEVQGAIIITKCIVGKRFQETLLANKDHLILHADITGNGGTIFEPNVVPYTESFKALHDIIDAGFDPKHIVLRCDPIIPTQDGMRNMTTMFRQFLQENFGITRIRVSVLDNYRHVKERFAKYNLPILYNGYFQAPDSTFEYIAKQFDQLFHNHPEISIECCAEPKLAQAADRLHTKSIEWCGCCGFKDAEILNISLPEHIGVNPQNRKGCLCITAKKELLTHPKPCPHKCLYCYWQD